MEHTIDGIELKLATNSLEDDSPAVLFQISSNHMEAEVLLSDPCVVSKKQWIVFRDYMTKDWDELSQRKALIFCSSSGEVSTSCDRDWIIFTTSKYGVSGDGDSVIKLSRDGFGDVFVKMLDLIIANEMMNKSWDEMKN